MSEPVQGTLVMDDEGLHLPGSVAGVEDGFTIRTPAATIDVPSIFPGVNVWPVITSAHFDVSEADAHNPELLPERVELQRYAEDPTLWKVDDQTGGGD